MKKEFSPQVSPQEMLELGIFGGWYFKGDIDEYPETWFKEAKISTNGFNKNLNFFEIMAGQPMSIWKNKGWITPEDPLGWFQWYCRYSLGRRIPRVDAFQIRRWQSFGPRHIGAIKKNCEKGNIYCRKRQRQALLQWAYDPFI
ncbi:MAG: hypothetical protein VYC46_05025 [Pseudomonadota bacterium]|jgi:hypothetical protein|nr:hypothetical protein [Pseudomonadota bacterium]|tara:strand:+ start:5133 stop:5561 length:429 start_codon:yes stop_codon:yes gene_type:complete